MNLGRAIGKFCDLQVYGWNSDREKWVSVGVKARLSTFDRFITERTFGQKKRILHLSGDDTLPEGYPAYKLESVDTVFLLESSNQDAWAGDSYGRFYLVRAAPHKVKLCKQSYLERSSGARQSSGVEVLGKFWVDIERYSATSARKFEEVEYSRVNITFPKEAPVDSDCYIVLENGFRYNVDEVYDTLDLIGAKGKAVGSE